MADQLWLMKRLREEHLVTLSTSPKRNLRKLRNNIDDVIDYFLSMSRSTSAATKHIHSLSISPIFWVRNIDKLDIDPPLMVITGKLLHILWCREWVGVVELYVSVKSQYNAVELSVNRNVVLQKCSSWFCISAK